MASPKYLLALNARGNYHRFVTWVWYESSSGAIETVAGAYFLSLSEALDNFLARSAS